MVKEGIEDGSVAATRLHDEVGTKRGVHPDGEHVVDEQLSTYSNRRLRLI
jgi:hypothetical protein